MQGSRMTNLLKDALNVCTLGFKHFTKLLTHTTNNSLYNKEIIT